MRKYWCASAAYRGKNYNNSSSHSSLPLFRNACSWFGSGSWIGFSPVWMRKWALKSPLSWFDFLHSVHLCDFSPLWVSIWFFRIPSYTNDFSHSVQGWGFSPACISKCLPNVCPDLLNDFLHSVVKLCCFSTLSLYTCSINFPVLVNDFLHCAQVWGFSPVWMRV